MRLAGVAHPDDERVVEHRSIALRDGVEPLGKVRDALGVELADRDGELVRAVHVADRVAVLHDAEFLPRVILSHAAGRVDGHHVRQAGGDGRGGDRALRLESFGSDAAVELVDRGRAGLEPALHRRDLGIAGAHLLEGVQVDVELLAIHRRQFDLDSADVAADPVQQLVARVVDLRGAALRHAAEERPEGEIRLARHG